jgi:hypothetical protein
MLPAAVISAVYGRNLPFSNSDQVCEIDGICIYLGIYCSGTLRMAERRTSRCQAEIEPDPEAWVL